MKKNSKKTLFVFALSMFFMSSCSTHRPKMSEHKVVKESTKTTVIISQKMIENKSLVGSWKWTETSGGFAGIRKTPQSEGYTMSINFKENATYERLKNGKITKKGTYSLEKKKIYSQPKEVLLLGLKGDGMPQIVKFSDGGKKLILSESVHDGFSYAYDKMN